MSIPASARRHRPTTMDPEDTNRRVNYRPTALPRSHHRNMSPYRSAGARWLSEDEGGDTAKKVDRFSDDDGRGKHVMAAPRHDMTRGEEVIHAQDRSSSPQSNTNKSSPSATEGASGPSAHGRSRVPSAGLLAAKAQWQAMEHTGRRRLRRANSQEAAPESSTAQPEPIEGDSGAMISGHPLASEGGVPMPSLRDIAPIRRRTSGVATFKAAPSPESGSSSDARPVLAVSTPAAEPASASRSNTHVPDYAPGRGGDGVSGNGPPSGEPFMGGQQEQSADEFKRKILPELKSILTWYEHVYFPSFIPLTFLTARSASPTNPEQGEGIRTSNSRSLCGAVIRCVHHTSI
jgi:hypothetical protein